MIPKCKTEWALGEVPPRTEIEKIQIDLNSIKMAFVVISQIPEQPYTHYQKINDIERILFDIERLYQNMLRTVDLGWTVNIAHIGLYGGL